MQMFKIPQKEKKKKVGKKKKEKKPSILNMEMVYEKLHPG